VRSVETGDMTVVGVNRWTDSEASPLSAGGKAIETVDPRLEAGVVER
jgi:(2R)-ethylmalonyl-CoA mutase